MAGRLGHATGQFLSGNDNPYLSSEIDNLTEAVDSFDDYQWRTTPYTLQITYRRPHAPLNRGIIGEVSNGFRQDFYERVHIFPSRISLGTVASEQTRQVSIWNAYTRQTAELQQINSVNAGGLILTGPVPPLAMSPLEELMWTLRITSDGSPQINAQFQFEFSNVPSPLPLVITGTRAALMPVVPEVPVTEVWEWLTDVHVAVEGSEQRVGLRRMPRRSLRTNLVFVSAAELREQYRTLLAVVGRLFIPYFQYATTLSQAALPGDQFLAFDVGMADVRDNDFVVISHSGGAQLLQLNEVGSAGATVFAPFAVEIPKGAIIAPAFASFVPNNINLQRAAMNEYGTLSLASEAIYPRSSHQRPGSTATMTYLDGYPILERRPLANDMVPHSFDTGQQRGDSKTGLVDQYSYWDFTKVEQSLKFLVRRVGRTCGHVTGVAEFDYWRRFCDEMRGSLNTFLLSTYRPDQIVYSGVAPGADSMVLFGPSYVDEFWPAAAYHYISITTAKGDHYAKVTGATKDSEDNSVIGFSPALPNIVGWDDIKNVSYLTKLRISDDEVELEHYPFETIFKLQVRTVKE